MKVLSYFIGLGGSGSKCGEAVTHLAASGLGPRELSIAFIDQDQSNGNLGRTKQLLDCYQRKIRTRLYSDEHNLGASTLFNTSFRFPLRDMVWSPLPARQTFQDLFQRELMKEELRWACDALYSEKVQTMDFVKGFEGEAHVGAAVLLALTRTPLMDDIYRAVQQANEGVEVRLFLTASAFGGTGASAFPVLARLIRQEIKQRNLQASVKLGGMLLLPYFRYPANNNASGNGRGPAAFMEVAQAALRYYYRLFQQAQTFDSLYFLGWDPLIELGYNKKGGKDQVNPPLPPELYAAIAAANFFAEPKSGFFRIGRQEGEPLTWQDVPDVLSPGPARGRAGAHLLRNRLGSLARFAFAYRNAFHPYLTDRLTKDVMRQPWYRHLIKAFDLRLDVEGTHELLESMDMYCKEFLGWAASLCLCPGEGEVALFEVGGFAPTPGEPGPGPVPLREPEDFDPKKFAGLVPPLKADSLHKVFTRMCRKGDAGERKGLGIFFGRLHDECVLESLA